MRIIIKNYTTTDPAVGVPPRPVAERLAASGVRLTRTRQKVLAVLAAAEGPRSAAELFQEMNGAVPLSSIYRTLSVLEEADVLEPHHGARGLTRYELAEWIAGHHHHLVCLNCGGVEDVQIPGETEDRLESLIAGVAGSAGFSVSSHELEVAGTCRMCA